MTAVRSYKEIIASMTDAVDRRRAMDQEQAAVLSGHVVELAHRMIQAGEREAVTRLAIALRWEAVLEALWDEQWMRLRPLPKPNPAAAGRDLGDCDDDVEERYQALLEAVRGRGIRARRRRP